MIPFFRPTNPLEHLLARAVADPSAREALCRALTQEPLVVIQPGPPPKRSQLLLGHECAPFEIKYVTVDGKPHLPVFTSEARIATTLPPRTKVGCLRMSGRAMLTMLKGHDLVLNPQSSCAMAFTATEVESILELAPDAERKVGEVLVAHPLDYPYHLIDAIKPFLRSSVDVRAAYVADVIIPGVMTRYTTIGLAVSGNWTSVLEGAAGAVRDVTRVGENVNFVHLNGSDNEVVESYMRQNMRPFYRRRIFGIF